MEHDGPIVRTAYPVVPSRVEYRLSNMDSSPIKPFHDLCCWATGHIKERDRARREFDAREEVKK
jgi:DNA-binding HxlR family transcriptional regulator